MKHSEGNTAFAANDYDTAIQKYTEAAEIDSSNHVYFSNRRFAWWRILST
jgi:stress-induced-phosphoprotein 1